ncbi:translation initiation factor IF-2 [Rhodothermus bifroesti]|uniref:Translation initiation factor IF-2 n=1 Tax=Rhodothermus marinus TaxID=29549 RepID=A0A7V2F7E3_RHOMR|nr:translation initiation factor IF-2 [Rhodothermus bifroesti]GBD01042.1 hypothetical protein HRbin18_00760 [bacterium HR18]
MQAEHIRQLIERFREQFVALTADEIQRLVEEARTEALAEARALLKEQMLQAILEHSATLQARYAEKTPSRSPSPPPAKTEPAATSQRPQFVTPRVTLVSRPETPPEEPTETAGAEKKNGNELDQARKILKEIEALRQQLSQNEAWLSRLRPSEASSAQDSP